MFEDFNSKMARVVTEHSIPVKEGSFSLIIGPMTAAPLMRAVYEAVILKGGHATVLPQLEGLQSFVFKHATDEQLTWVNPLQKFLYENVDAIYQVMAPANTKASTRIDPQKMAMAQNASREVFETFISRIGNGLSWILMPYPTNGLAQEAQMSLYDYTEFVYNACAFDKDDPVAYWQDVSVRQQKLVDYMEGKSKARIIGPDIDLEFNFAGRKWVNCDARLNFPDGEIFTGPVEDSVNGYVNFNLRTMYGGREVNGIKVKYENGVIVEATADKNEEFLLSQLDMDAGARRLGEFAIGTNFGIQEVTGNTLFDEKDRRHDSHGCRTQHP